MLSLRTAKLPSMRSHGEAVIGPFRRLITEGLLPEEAMLFFLVCVFKLTLQDSSLLDLNFGSSFRTVLRLLTGDFITIFVLFSATGIFK